MSRSHNSIRDGQRCKVHAAFVISGSLMVRLVRDSRSWNVFGFDRLSLFFKKSAC